MNIFARFAQDESGATAIEYGLIAALISVVIIGAVAALGGSLTSVFNDISTCLGDAEACAAANQAPPAGG
ncbi:Flp family type IVb pilin [Devosia sp.]|uniref:Flp family type IVb pilin n=1 Tax=Devosia sp. TaxID=1871048 RepID=UPI0025FED2C6|nr:Flp family type IVb pilin [Devosia sp.]MCR6637318.1 Flp family type IVb pilin [Devosia sp.]